MSQDLVYSVTSRKTAEPIKPTRKRVRQVEKEPSSHGMGDEEVSHEDEVLISRESQKKKLQDDEIEAAINEQLGESSDQSNAKAPLVADTSYAPQEQRSTEPQSVLREKFSTRSNSSPKGGKKIDVEV